MVKLSPAMARRVEAAIAAFRASLPDPGPNAQLSDAFPRPQAVKGGITNRNFRIEVGGQPYFLRLFGQETGRLGVDREAEVRCHTLAAGRGLAPPVLMWLPGGEGFVARWIEGGHSTPDDLARPANLERLARLLRECHEGAPFPPIPSPFEAVRRLGAGSPGSPAPSGARAALAILARLEQALMPPPHMAPIHNDVVPENVMDDGERLWLVDWEYAGQGDPFMDLGTVAAYLNLDTDACAAFLQAWGGAPDATAETFLARVMLMAAVSNARDAFWCFRQATLSDLEMDFTAYGQAFLDAFLERAASPDFVRWLEMVE